MSFTDDDLKRLRNELDHTDHYPKMTALLHRLECAEKCARLWVNYLPDHRDSIYAKEWLKSCGMEGK